MNLVRMQLKPESGKRAVLDYEVVALARVLKVSVSWLLEG